MLTACPEKKISANLGALISKAKHWVGCGLEADQPGRCHTAQVDRVLRKVLDFILPAMHEASYCFLGCGLKASLVGYRGD